MWTCKIWKTIYQSLQGRWVAPNIAQDDRTTNVQGFYTLQNEQQDQDDTIDAVSHDNTSITRDYQRYIVYVVCKSSKKAGYEFSGLLQTCMQLKHRSMPYSNVQQSMVPELHKCTKTLRKPKRIQNFSKWPRGHRQKSCCTSHTM